MNLKKNKSSSVAIKFNGLKSMQGQMAMYIYKTFISSEKKK